MSQVAHSHQDTAAADAVASACAADAVAAACAAAAAEMQAMAAAEGLLAAHMQGLGHLQQVWVA